MKLNASQISRAVFAALRKTLAWPIKVVIGSFYVIARPFLGHPILTWVLTIITLACFGLEGQRVGSSSAAVSAGEYWVALGLWVFASIFGPIMIRIINRQTEGISLARRLRAARLTAAMQLIWVGATALIWLFNSSKLADPTNSPVQGLLASLLLLPSFSLNLILLQRGLRDKGLEADIILVNKTGTLTTGRRKLAFIQVAANSQLKTKDEVLALAAGLEPEDLDDLAKAVRDRAKRRKVTPIEVKDVMSFVGLGMAGRVDGSRVELGGPAQLVAHNTRIDVADLVRADQANTQGQTVLYLLIDGQLCGYLGFADQVRTDVKYFVHLLQYRRKRVIVYSGDAHETTKFVANQLDCDDFYGEVLPHEHDNLLQKLSRDGSIILESKDVEATALQIERAVRDRRFQMATILLSLITPCLGLITGIFKLAASTKPGILVPSIFSAFGLACALVLIIISRSIWHKVPQTISEATLDDESDDE